MQTPDRSLDQMRDTAPLVQNITNFVAMNVMANAMLAAGASPAMVHAREEAAEFAGLAIALTVNIGTLSPDWAGAMTDAAAAANDHGKPWVLDPVAVGATTYRQTVAAQLLALNPTVIRGNASEIIALAGKDASGKGVDAGDAVSVATDAAAVLARRTGGVVAVTGQTDLVTDGTRFAEVQNGHPLMPRVTALGCSLTGIVGAFVAGQDPFEATVAALAFYGLAGERAANGAKGPGSFQVAFLDALYTLDGHDLARGARIVLS
ncbi:hydroxyethylthiazole kinase [Sagittula stellata]|uniref:Hydroxyethylthiazole kinase n=1 Tax=Sagittula stellata (strain ATCC 700073 / DSM 11524 / E-37) TaxID=388399 RepID=A3K893_SAGS3|nr:hydroxyethylthiazole kinase [Sagittula stellata]EBA06572.1 Putative hydoxyethylthiazole kinase [Sagittula stellata E-37]